MKALVLEDVSKLVYKDVPDPIIKPGEVLLKIKACGICSSDIPRIFTTGTYHFPTIPGHEFSGEIIDCAPDVDNSLIGKRAVVFPLVPCGKCPSCAAKEYARCSDYNYFGSRCDGAFAEYISVPVWNIVRFSNKIPYTTAAMCEPASVAKHCADRGKINEGDTVTVVGTGTIGYISALWAKTMGAKKVIIVGRNKSKLEFSKELGLDYTINTSEDNFFESYMKITGGEGSDVVLECVGSNAAIKSSVKFAKKGGRIVLAGNPEGDIKLEKNVYWKILRNELTVMGTWNSSYNSEVNNWNEVITALENHKLDISKLVTHTFRLDEYEKAFKILKDKTEFSVKVMFAE